MVTASSRSRSLARQLRERFVSLSVPMLQPLRALIEARLMSLADAAASSSEMQLRRDAWLEFKEHGEAWQLATAKTWQGALSAAAQSASSSTFQRTDLALISYDTVEYQVIASRIALSLLDSLGWEFSDLRQRLLYLDDQPDLNSNDVVRPEALMQLMMNHWERSGLARQTWLRVHDSAVAYMTDYMLPVYHECNHFLIEQGVMPEIQLRPLVKGANSAQSDSELRSTAAAHSGVAADGDTALATGMASRQSLSAPTAAATPDEVLQQMRKLLQTKVAGFVAADAPTEMSKSLSLAMEQPLPAVLTELEHQGGVPDVASLARVSHALRQRSTELKSNANSDSERAVIEVVALMFQSILAEDRLPANIRVWFARLQMPVLRVAVGEPSFFDSSEHPARLLIDRMGACVMGFDASAISGGALEAEVRRVVQVIEQYPETGQRVFKLVYDEFQSFLSKFLTEKGATQRLVSVAQQVEQKETMVIQFSIELRNMLDDMPVREEIRNYLFKVWAEVVAIAAMKNGPQHPDTLALKKSASDLVWAASAKPSRDDRARVIRDLPPLLQRIRQGMNLVGMDAATQEMHIKSISDTLADAFMSRTDAIPHARIEQLAQRLSNLEEFISDGDVGDLQLDSDSIELILGIEATEIEIVTDAGVGGTPSPKAVADANQLALGTWHTLDHNGKIGTVQLVWRSARKQLNLFAAADGRSYLMQAGRLASYLDAGLLSPMEHEALTARATRDALSKLDANPERLLK